MIKKVKFIPAFDKRNTNPKKNYGIHGVDILFTLKSKKGVIQFLIYTNWQLPNVQKEFDNRPPDPKFPYLFHEPMAADIEYHSYKPIYEGQEPSTNSCSLLGGKPCYYDGNSMKAEEYFNILRTGGDKKLWEVLAERYKDIFGEKP